MREGVGDYKGTDLQCDEYPYASTKEHSVWSSGPADGVETIRMLCERILEERIEAEATETIGRPGRALKRAHDEDPALGGGTPARTRTL
ncbi:hypothetical protein [Streptomyces hokutonensis]|uniref:hypothetical protein n=1 Tax=Streptomyces hokutonensis TaxID=1306990 RepID=UPI0036802FA2